MSIDALDRDVRKVAEDGSSGAIFSPDGTYRYCLWRVWDPDGPTVAFVALNPATADETDNDATISTCERYARDWGYGRLLVGNLFAYRATDPVEMKCQSRPVGPNNDAYLERIAGAADRVVAAWGVHGTHRDRERAVLERLDVEWDALTTTKEGHPGHPLRKSADLEPELWMPASERK